TVLLQHHDTEECFHNINKNEALSTNSRSIKHTSGNIYSYRDDDDLLSYEHPVKIISEDAYTAEDMDWGRCESNNQNYTYNYTDTDDIPDGNTMDYWNDTVSAINENTYGYGCEYNSKTPMTTAKILPSIPVSQNGSEKGDKRDILPTEEGMYPRRSNRFGIRLPAAPINNSTYPMLPQAVPYQKACCNLNGYAGCDSHVGLLDERIGSFIYLPSAAAPLRILPQPQMQQQHRFYGDYNNIESDFYGNQKRETDNRDLDVSSQVQRPYTSMLPLEYTDFSDNGFNVDNFSTYSDTPPTSNMQLKVQQQRKISLMMAMTTASVIASGETRLPVQRNVNNVGPQFTSEKCSTAPTTTRKLPKRLPSPLNKTLYNTIYTTSNTNTTATANIAISARNTNVHSLPSQPFPEKNSRPKQLPKLPIAKTQAVLNTNMNSIPNPKLNTSTVLISNIETEKIPSTAKHFNDLRSSCSIESALTTTVTFVDGVKNLRQLAKEDQTLNTYASTHPSMQTLPATDCLNTTLNLIETPQKLEISDIIGKDVKNEKMIVARSLETSLFDIPEYLKPYSMDSSTFSSKKTDYSPIRITTSTTTTSNITSTIQEKSKNSLKLSLPSYEYPMIMNNISTESVEIAPHAPTPSNDSSSTDLNHLSKPKSLVQWSSTVDQGIKKSIRDHATELVINNSDVFITTNSATKPLVILGTGSSCPAVTDTETSITFQSSVSLSYNDYMKKFELPELPPIPDICTPVISNTAFNNVLDTTADTAIPPITTTASISGTTADTTIVISNVTDTTLDSVARDTDFAVKFGTVQFSSIIDKVQSNLTATRTSITPTQETEMDRNKTDEHQLIENVTKNEEENKYTYNQWMPLEPVLKNSVERPEQLSPLCTAVSFDDNFYDSFNVDLLALTTTIGHIEDDTCTIRGLESNTNLKELGNTNELSQKNDVGAVSINGECNERQNNLQILDNVNIYAATTSKTKSASTVLGGISKGLIGGLDGVLGGVGSSQAVSGKRSFSFNLASKLVPSGLLSGGKPTTSAATTTKTTSIETKNSDSKTSVLGYGYVYEYELEGVNPTAAINYSTSHSIKMPSNVSDYGMETCHDQDFNHIIDDGRNNEDSHSCKFSRMEKLGLEEEYNNYSNYVENNHIFDGAHNDSNIIFEPLKMIPENLAMKIESQTSQPIVSKTSGMFGSIFDKAAAAVQSATHAVNQSASSVASAVAQKTTSVTTDSKLSDLAPAHKNIDGNVTATKYNVTADNDYVELMANQELLSVKNSGNCDDYKNSNLSLDDDFINDKRVFSNYNSDNNQGQINNTISAGQKILPKVRPAGSNGKKLPTINGKSGVLIKQHPTEIYDIEAVQEKTAINDDLSTYHDDSDQDDYYLNHLETTPPCRRGANDYYEHVGTGYDYREDFFNEEDEYKYLEQQQKQQVVQSQSSRDYVDAPHDEDDECEFTDGDYVSDEDCGNYLGESSSGSIPATVTCLPKIGAKTYDGDICTPNMEAPVSVSLQLVATHQLIKKQDSIILEEDELHDEISQNQVTDGDDQLPELEPIIRKKKKVLMRGETEEVVSGHMLILRKPEISAKQRWHWAFNKIIMQINVST
ncbi:hypothetical protein KR222_001391, partial [Zaprionus bogoriensis]